MATDPGAILRRAGIDPGPAGPVRASGATWPVFLFADAVLKLFPGPDGVAAQTSEAETLRHLARDPDIPAPALLAEGTDPVPFLVTRRLRAPAWHDAPPGPAAALRIAHEIGRVVARVHALGPGPLHAAGDLPHVPLGQALAATVLPSHLHAPLAELASAFPPKGAALVHADLMERHILVCDGRLAGLLDWGDACAADPLLDLPKLHLGLFAANPDLLRGFLDGAGWQPGPDFAPRGLAMCVWRQAQGLVQHPGAMDVFHRLPGLLTDGDLATPDRLARRLFCI